MSPSLRLLAFAFLFSTFLVMSPVAFGQPTIVNFDFGAVRIACSNGYAYEGPVGPCSYLDTGPTQNFDTSPGFGWILGDVTARIGLPEINFGAGLTGPDTAFDPPPFDGLPFNQVVFLQSLGSFVWQPVPGFTS